MSDLERRLEDAMRRQADEAGDPRPLTSRELKRVRTTHAALGALAGLVLIAGGLSIAALRSPEPGPQFVSVPHPIQHVGPYTHRLYVLDARPEQVVVALQPRGRTADVVDRYDVGSGAYIELSPDGRRLYALAFIEDEGDYQTMATYDTRTGERLDLAPVAGELPEGWQPEQYKIWPFNDGLVSSPDGGRLYFVERSLTKRQEHDSIWIGTYDTSRGSVLPASAEIQGCDQRVLFPQIGGRLVIACTRSTDCCYEAYSETSDVRWLTIGDDGSTVHSHVVPLSPPRSSSVADDSGPIASAVESPDGRWIYVVTLTGRVFVVDVQRERVDRVIDLELIGSFEVSGPRVALSPDGKTLYLGASDTVEITQGDATSIQRFDVATWRRTGRTHAELPFHSLAFGPDGDYLYAMTPEAMRGSTAPIQVFDARTLEQVGGIRDHLDQPVLAEVPRLGRT